MKSITLRDLPEEVARRITDRAKKTGASLNRTVIELLSEAEGTKRKTVYHDLDHLAGSWSAEEAKEFDGALEQQRLIEPEAWK